MQIVYGTGCGDFFVKDFFPPPRKADHDTMKKSLEGNAIENSRYPGGRRFYYAVVGAQQSKQWDEFLKSYGFRCIQKTLNGAHHNGEDMIRAYFLCV